MAAVVAAMLSALGVWRLTAGPVEVPFLSTYLAAQLEGADLPREARWREVAVHWPFLSEWLHVRVADVRATNTFRTQGLGVRIALLELIRGRVVVAGVVLYSPEIVLEQNEDNGPSWTNARLTADSEYQIAAVFGGTEVLITDGTLTFVMGGAQGQVQIVNLEAIVTQEDDWLLVRGTGDGFLPGHPLVPLELTGQFARPTGEISATLVFQGAEPRALWKLTGIDPPFEIEHARLEGKVAVNGPLESIALSFQAAATTGQIRQPGPPQSGSNPVIPIDAMAIDFRYSAADAALELREFALTGPLGHLAVEGSFQDPLNGVGEIHGRFEGAIPVLDMAGWLGSALDRAAHNWLREHVDAGVVTEASFSADFPEEDGIGRRPEISGVIRDAVVDWETGQPALQLGVVELSLAGQKFTGTSAVATSGAATLKDLQLHSANLFAKDGEAVVTTLVSGESGALLVQAGLDLGPTKEALIQGPITDAELRVLIPFARELENEVTLHADFRDIHVSTNAAAEQSARSGLHAIAGTAEYGPDGFAVRFAGNFGDSIRIEDAALSGEQLEGPLVQLVGTVSGPVGAISELGSTALGATGLPSELHLLEGTARVRAEVEMPLAADAEPIVRTVSGTFGLPSFTVKTSEGGLWGGSTFREVSGALTWSGDERTVTGDASLADSDLSFVWRTGHSQFPDAQMLTVRGVLGPEAQQALGLDIASLDGLADVAVSARRVRASDEWEFDAEAELSGVDASISAIDWNKPPTAPLHARIRGVLAGSGPLVLRVEGSGMDVRGQIWVVDGRLDRAEFEQLNVGEFRLAGTIARDANGLVIAELEGEQADLRPFMSTEVGQRAMPAGFMLHVNAKHVRTMAPDRAGPLTGTVRVGESGVQEMQLKLRFPGGEDMELVGVRKDGALDLVMTGSNARTVANALGLGVAANNGALRVEAVENGGELAGTVHVDEFHIVDAPVFLQLLQTITVVGVLEQIAGGGGVAFGSFDADFTAAEGVIEIRNGIAKGVTLGVSVEGAIHTQSETLDLGGELVPAYAINTLLSHVPLIGQIFTGTRSSGIIAADYAVVGQAEEPTVTVRPLQFLMPGILRDMLRTIEDSVIPSPGPHESPAMGRPGFATQ